MRGVRLQPVVRVSARRPAEAGHHPGGRDARRQASACRPGFSPGTSPDDRLKPVASRLTARYGDPMAMRKDVREFIRRLEAVGLTVEATPGHYHVYRDGKPLRKANGMPFTLPFSPDTTRWRKTAINDLRKLGIDV